MRALAAFAGMIPKLFLAYRLWVWMDFFVRIFSLTVFYYFWNAVYAGGGDIRGLSLAQTLNYILLAQILSPLVQSRLPMVMGRLVREGDVGIELLRPVDFQSRWYAECMGVSATMIVIQIPLVIIACVCFEMHLPSDPRVWAVFAVTVWLGQAVVFLFDWMFSCLVFYTTEVWGLWVLREGVAAFFSGALVPLQFMPEWLERICRAMPFAQALYVPVSILSGIAPVSDAPRLWLIQIAWIVGLGILSRTFFGVAIRKVTVQGG